MVVKWITHANRQRRRVMAAQAARKGIQLEILRSSSAAEVSQHIKVISEYLEKPSLLTAALVRQLSNYLENGKELTEDGASRERVYHKAHRNFISDNLEEQQLEMELIAGLSPGGIDPIEHIVISWRRDERPTPEQMEEAAAILLEMVGLADHQAFVVGHGDTDNIHCHIAVNRVDPATGRRASLGDDWGLEALHQAIAVIEHRQKWRPQENALYRANADGVFDRDTGAKVRNEELLPCATHQQLQAAREARREREQFSLGAIGYERRRGLWSAERYLKKVIWPAIDAAQDWFDLHWTLGQLGARYEAKGTNGAVIKLGEREHPANKAHHAATLAKLERVMGPYRPSGDVPLAPYVELEFPSRPAKLEMERRRAVKIRARVSAVAGAAVLREVQRRHELDQKELNAAAPWRGNGKELNALRAVAGRRYRDARSPIEDTIKLIKRGVAEGIELIEEWLVDEVLHKKRKKQPLAFFVGRGAPVAEIGEYEVPSYRREVLLDEVRYSRGSELAFVERPNTIDVYAIQDEHAIRAGLKLAKQKWGTVVMTGPPEFIERALRIAVDEGIQIGNPELQERCRQLEREQVERHLADQERLEKFANLTPRTVTSEETVSSEEVDLSLFDTRIAEWREADARQDPLAPVLAADVLSSRSAGQVDELEAEGFPFMKRFRAQAAEELALRDLAQTIRSEAGKWRSRSKDDAAPEIVELPLPPLAKPCDISQNSRLRSLLGKESALLDLSHVQARIEAAAWFQRGQRLAKDKGRKGSSRTPSEGARIRALVAGTLAADEAEASPGVLKMLAITIREDPAYLQSRRLLDNADDLKIYQLSEAWKNGIAYVPLKNAGRHIARMQRAQRQGY